MPFWQKSDTVFHKMWIIFLLWITVWFFLTFVFLQSGFWRQEKFIFSDKKEQNIEQSESSPGIFWFFLSEKKPENGSVFWTPKMREAYNVMQQKYYGFSEKTQKDIENAMIGSMVSALGDEYTEFFDNEATKDFYADLSGDFEGIGAVIGENTLGIRVEKILKNSPAERADLRVGDVIVLVDGIEMLGKKPDEAVKKIRGKKGSVANIEFLRGKEKKKAAIVRDTLHVPSVDSRILTGSTVGYIQVNTFGEATHTEFSEQYQELRQKNISGLIIDLRFNGGGFLTTAENILGNFLPKNSLISVIKESDPTKDEKLNTSIFSQPDTNFPLVILVNEFSASASEIVAGALKDYSRAIIVWEKTFGKGSVQEMHQFDDGSMMKLTIANWYTPGGKNINKEGISPDVMVKILEEDYKNLFDRQLDIAKKILQDFSQYSWDFNAWKKHAEKYSQTSHDNT